MIANSIPKSGLYGQVLNGGNGCVHDLHVSEEGAKATTTTCLEQTIDSSVSQRNNTHGIH